jgi:hypothetical protein
MTNQATWFVLVTRSTTELSGICLKFQNVIHSDFYVARTSQSNNIFLLIGDILFGRNAHIPTKRGVIAKNDHIGLITIV